MRARHDLEPAWTTLTLPDSSPAVGFSRLGGDPESGAFAALVHFPVGWTRPAPGHYLVDEELLVLEGELRMSTATYRVDDFAHLPAGYLRDDSATPGGALVIAFFSGRAEWVRGPAIGEPSSDSVVQPLNWREVPPRASSVAARSRPLGTAGGAATLIADGPLALRAPRQSRVELFSLTTRSWAIAAPGEAMPALAPPCLCRLRGASQPVWQVPATRAKRRVGRDVSER